MKKKLFYLIVFFLVSIGLIVVIILSQHKYNNAYLSNVEVNIEPNDKLIDENTIINILEDNDIYLDSTVKIKDVEFNKIEKLLKNNPYIDNAEVFSEYKKSEMKLKIKINLISPLVRVIAKNNSQFYIDSNAEIVSVFSNKNFSTPILIAKDYEKAVFDSIFIDSLSVMKKNPDEFNKNELLHFLTYINKSELWRNQIDQIVLEKNASYEPEVELITRLGQHRIIFGTLKNYSFKFNKLLSLYREVLMKENNWEKFSVINVKYSDQINCK